MGAKILEGLDLLASLRDHRTLVVTVNQQGEVVAALRLSDLADVTPEPARRQKGRQLSTMRCCRP